MSSLTSLKGKNVLITGTLDNFSRAEAKAAAEKAGATVKPSLSGTVQVVVMGGGNPKVVPEEHPAVVISEKKFQKLVAASEPESDGDESSEAPKAKKPAKKAAGKRKAATKDDEEDEKPSKKKRKAPAKAESSDEDEDEDEESEAPAPKKAKKASKVTSLAGKGVLITGTLKDYTRATAKAAAEKAGATVKPGLTGNVGVVVMGGGNPKPIPDDHPADIISEKEFKELVSKKQTAKKGAKKEESDDESTVSSASESESEPEPEPQPKAKKGKKSKISLDGKGVLITGTLANYSRKEAKEAAEAAGATVKPSLTSNVDIVVMGTGNPKPIPASHPAYIMSEAEFATIVN